MALPLIYIEPESGEYHERDPLLLKLRRERDVAISVIKYSQQNLERNLAVEAERICKDERGLIVLHAFLSPESEGVRYGRWDPPQESLQDLLYFRRDSKKPENNATDKCLKSLQLMWDFLPELRQDFSFYITTQDIDLPPRSFHALRSSFFDGSVSVVYSWLKYNYDVLRIEDICERFSIKLTKCAHQKE